MQITLIKSLGGWSNGDESAEKLHSSVKLGSVIHSDFKRMRNAAFHRKLFALFQLAFEYWEVPDLDTKWGKPEKSFDTFRKNIIILAGYGHPVFNINGTFKMKADSISFGAMDQDTFNDMYSKILDVLMKRIPMLSTMTKEEVDDLTNKVLEFS